MATLTKLEVFTVDEAHSFQSSWETTISHDISENDHSVLNFRHWRTLAATLVAALASLSAGTVIGYSSPAIPNINSHPNLFQLDETHIAISASIICLGAIVGGVSGGLFADRFGRRKALIFSSLPAVVGWVLIGFAPTVSCMHVGRVLTGFSSGVADSVVPVYISEISEKSVRGFMGSCHEIFINVGILFVFAFGIFLHWNQLAFACAVVPIAMLVLLFLVPESPRWLISNVTKQETMDALVWLRGPINVGAAVEFNEIQQNIQFDGSSTKISQFRQPALLKPLSIIVGLFFFQQMAGYGVLPEYMVSIFQDAGSAWNPYVQTAVVGASGVLANIISAVIVDRAGRRPMLLLSSAIMALSVGGLASFFTAKYFVRDSDFFLTHFGWLPIVSLIVYNFGVCLGYGPIPFYLSSELFPLRARSKVGSFGISSVWLFAFVTTISFPKLLTALSGFGVYWMMVGFAVAGFLFALIVVPETKGRSLEEIERSMTR